MPRIIAFSPIDYNALNQNWSIVQGCDGNIYVANNSGVLVFNGMKWKLVRLPNNQRPRSVYKGSDCKIYVSGYEAFGIVGEEYIPLADDLLKDSNQEYWNIFGDSSMMIFQSFSDVFLYDYKDFTKLSSPGNVMFGKYVDESLILPKVESGVYKIVNKEVLQENPKKQLPNGSKIVGLAQDGIFATQNQGLFRKGEEGYSAINSELNEQLKQDQINNIIRTKSGAYIIGTILNGIYVTSDLKKIEYHINKSNGLSNNTILSLFEDDEGNLWCGLDKGIDLIKLSSELTYFYDKQGQLGSVFTSALYNGHLYLGTNQGLFKENLNNGFDFIEGSQGQVWSLINIAGDLICGHNKGTFLVGENEFRVVSTITGGWCMKAIDESTFIQSSYTGLVLFEKLNGIWSQGVRIKNGDFLLESFEIMDDMLVAFHPHHGLSKLILSKDFFDVVAVEPIVSEKAQNPLFIAEDNGIIIRDGQWKTYVEKDFMNKQIPEASNFSADNKAILDYAMAVDDIQKSDQISNLRFNKPQGVQEYYLVGFKEGYIKIPKDYRKSSKENVQLDFMQVNGAMLALTDEKNIHLQSNENDIAFQFRSKFSDAPSFALKYQLKGWDGEWFDIPDDGNLRFNNLQDGSYSLSTSDQNNIVNFEIAPRWYESWPGFLLYLSMGLLTIYIFNLLQSRKHRKELERLQKAKQKEIESERIKAKNKELENDVVYKNKMLANSTMTLVQKNKMLIDLKSTLSKELKSTNAEKRRQILHLIEMNINNDDDWELFEHTFAQVHEDFLDELLKKHPSMTNGELRLAAYIKMDLSSKEIAPLMNISTRSIENKRYRLRKKLGVENESLKAYIQAFM